MIDLLLRHSAKDDEGKALTVAAEKKDDLIISKLLVLRANQDPEHEINRFVNKFDPFFVYFFLFRKGIADFVGKGSSLVGKSSTFVGSLAYASIFPSASVMINWHNLAQGSLMSVKEQYLIDASVRIVNKAN